MPGPTPPPISAVSSQASRPKRSGVRRHQHVSVKHAHVTSNVLRLAKNARGEDEYGWRSEFVQLARTAATLGPLPVADNAQGK
jgi:hypothetical protein